MSDFECPNCGDEFCIYDLELWEVYEEDGKETEITCSRCDTDIIITSSVVAWSFEAVERDQ